MIDEREVRAWIARLESEESSWANYARLAVLYAVQDRQLDTDPRAAPVGRLGVLTADTGDCGDSDFLRAVAGKDPARAWAVVDELMDSLRVANERVYDRVMQQLRDL